MATRVYRDRVMIYTMKRRTARHLAMLRLVRLEDRVAPAGFNALTSRSDPTLIAESAGGYNYSSAFPHGLTTIDGRYTVFTSSAGNVVAGQIDANGGDDIFVYDRTSNTSELISHTFGSMLTAADGISTISTISADGRYLAFVSTAHNLIDGMTFSNPNPNTVNLFLYDRTTQACTLITHQYSSPTLSDTSGPSSEYPLEISANGQVVVFSSRSVNLVPNSFTNYNYPNHAYAYSVATGQITLMDHIYGNPAAPSTGARAFGTSADGRYVLILSGAKNLTSPSTSGGGNIYRYDRTTGQNLLITTSAVSGTVGSNNASYNPQISNDGSCISFHSKGTNLVPGYSGSGNQVYCWNELTGQVSLVSHSTAGSTAGANAASIHPSISGDGRYVTYPSAATNLIVNFVDGNASDEEDQYIYDRLTDQTKLISRKAGTTNVSANGLELSGLSSISADGRIVVFGDRGTDLIPGFVDGNGADFADMYAYDRITDTITLVDGRFGSVNFGPNRNSDTAVVSADGSTIVFTTAASDIMSGLVDTNGSDDVFVHSVATGSTVLATRRFGSPSLSAGGHSNLVRQSADGRFVVYASLATNLVPGQLDAESTQDVFLYDRQLNTTTLVSHQFNNSATSANDQSAIPVISADGRYVAYTSRATNLIQGFFDGNGQGVDAFTGADVYLFDRVTGTNQLVSHQAGNALAGGDQTSGRLVFPATQTFEEYALTINADGRYVGYVSVATDLVSGFVNNNGTSTGGILTGYDVFVYDRATDANTLVSHVPASPLSTGNDGSYEPTISGDGRYIAFWSYSHTLVTGMVGAQSRNVFVLDQQTGIITLASHIAGSMTVGGNDWSTYAAISNDGNYVVYQSGATNLVSGGTDTNNQFDVFLYDVQAQTNVLVSHTFDSPVNAGNYYSSLDHSSDIIQAISDDGRFVVFESVATNLISGFVDGNDINDHSDWDIFLFDRATGLNTLVSHIATSSTTSGNQISFNQSISGDGRFVSFASGSDNLVAGFTSPGGGGFGDLYIFDRLSSANRVVSHDMGNTTRGGDGPSYRPVINHDGSVITYLSQASNLVPGDFNSHTDIISYITPPPRVTSVQINPGAPGPQRSIIRSLTVTIDDYVFVDSGAVTVVDGKGSGVSSQVSVEHVDNTTVLTVTFSGGNTQFGSLADGDYELRIISSQGSGVSNLDGNGDGVGGDNYTFAFHRLFGDANGDRKVNAVDFAALRGVFGGSGVTFDFNNDGVVNAVDFAQFRSRFGVEI